MPDPLMLADGWSIPDDPELRTYLIESELCSEVFADAVIAKCGSLAQRATCSSSGGNWIASRANSSVASVGDPSDPTCV